MATKKRVELITNFIKKRENHKKRTYYFVILAQLLKLYKHIPLKVHLRLLIFEVGTRLRGAKLFSIRTILNYR